jgi:uroporphyrinogen-III decarboxylase
MDLEATARDYGGRVSFLAGMDVQDTLVNGTPETVGAEVRWMKRVFRRPQGGGLLLAAGNGILPDTPLENIEAMLEEMCGPSDGF